MRGRMVYAGYKKIGLLDTPLAPKYELYAQTAIDWANTPDRLDEFRIASKSLVQENLFRDRSVIQDYEKLILEDKE